MSQQTLVIIGMAVAVLVAFYAESRSNRRHTDIKFQAMETRSDAKFAGVDARFARIDDRFDRVDARFDRVDARFDNVDAKFDRVDARFEKIEAKFDARFDGIHQELRLIHQQIGYLGGHLTAHIEEHRSAI